MKKCIAVLIILIMAVGLCGCLKSEEAQKADDLIAEIGKVNLFSLEEIKAAQKAVNSLPEKEKKQLDNLKLLTEAVDEYNNIIIQEAREKILAIGEVTLESSGKITDARTAVGRLTSTQFNGLKEKEIYLKALDDYATLRAAQVEEKINAIGTVTLKSGDAIKEARSAYNALSGEEKGKVSNADKIGEAEERLAELEKAEEERVKRAAISRLKTTYDKVEGITWYEAKCQPYYADTRSFILPYIGKRDSGYTWMKIRYHYTGDSWVFYDNITIMVDGEKYYKSFDYNEVSRDNDSEVWEVAHETPSSSDIEMLEAIANSKETIVRFEGDDHRFDFKVSAADKQGIKDVLTAYEYLK